MATNGTKSLCSWGLHVGGREKQEMTAFSIDVNFRKWHVLPIRGGKNIKSVGMVFSLG